MKVAKKPKEDFYFIEEDDPGKIRKLVQASAHKLQATYHLPVSDIQVLSPIHSGDLGVDHLNIELQEQFNPSGDEYEDGDRIIKLGDKVIHTENDYDLGVFNGEVGTVKELRYAKNQAMLVEYGDREVWYPANKVCELDLAYALSVHKFQGSERAAVIIPVHEMIAKNLSMSLLYTAITRARKIVIIIGSKSAFSDGIRRQDAPRCSMLVQKINAKLARPA